MDWLIHKCREIEETPRQTVYKKEEIVTVVLTYKLSSNGEWTRNNLLEDLKSELPLSRTITCSSGGAKLEKISHEVKVPNGQIDNQ